MVCRNVEYILYFSFKNIQLDQRFLSHIQSLAKILPESMRSIYNNKNTVYLYFSKTLTIILK